MFETFFRNQGFDHITVNILIKLDVQSLWKCRLVCKGLHKFIESLEKSRKVKANYFKIICLCRVVAPIILESQSICKGPLKK